MREDFEFIVGDCGQVSPEERVGEEISLTFLPHLVNIDGLDLHDLSMGDATVVTIGPIKPEQAYLLGKSLLMAAKMRGVSE